MLTYLEIARRLRPRWVVWENVPGVLSSNGGRDFGSFLGALGELGYGWAYRVLDAQWVRTHGHPRAVPQRRRRVFVVGCLGDWTRAAQVLFERESVQRDSSPRRTKGQGASADAEGCAGTDIITSHRVAPCLETTSNDYSRADGFRMVAQPTEVSGTIAARFGQSRNNHEECVVQPIGYRWQNNRDGLQQDDAVAAMRASTGGSGFHEMNHPVVVQPVPFTKAKRAQSVNDDETWVDGQVNPTLSLFDQGDTRATTVAVAFPINTLTLGGRPDAVNDKRMTMGVGENGDPQFTLQAAHGHAVAVGFNWQNGGGYGNANDGLGITVEGTGPLQRCNTPAVAFSDTSATLKGGSGERGYPDPSDGNGHSLVAHFLRGEGFDASEDGTGRGTPLVPVETLPQQGYDAFHASTQETNAVATLRTLRSQIGEEAFAAWGLGILDSLQPQEVLRARLHGLGIRCATFSRSWPIDCAISRKEDRATWAMQSVREAQGEGCPSPGWQLPQQLAAELGAYLSELPRPGAQTERFVRDLWLAGEGIGFLREALSAFQEARRSIVLTGQTPTAMTVRRLTATECEFLQGFPRNYTLIPWRKKQAEDCPDGPRYKALGNSMAVNCMAWIGERIAALENNQ